MVPSVLSQVVEILSLLQVLFEAIGADLIQHFILVCLQLRIVSIDGH